MKKNLCFLATMLLLTVTAFSLKAQDHFHNSYRGGNHSSAYRNEFTFSPYHVMNHTFAIGYQHNFQKGAFFIQPSIMLNNNYKNEAELTGYGLDMQYKLFLQRQPRKVGVYAGPYVMLNSYSAQGKPTSDHVYRSIHDKISVFGMGVVFGVHFMFGRFTMDVQTGGGVRLPSGDASYFKDTDVFSLGYRGIVPKLNFNLGVAF